MNPQRWFALAATALLTVGAAVAVQAVTVGPAAAVTGLEVESVNGSSDPLAPQQATAEAICAPGKRVLGGGGGVTWYLNDYPYDIVVTRMQPVHPLTGQDRFIVTGERISGGTSTNWTIHAYAICADPLPGLHMVVMGSGLSSASSQLAQAACPVGEQVLGTGAYIYNSIGQVGLQVMRASASGTLVYAQGHEDADGYAGSWYVMAVAVCADPIDGYEVRNVASAEDGSESQKSADVACTNGKQLYGVGGAAAFDAPGAASLRWITVDGARDKADANFIENTPTSTDWDFIVAQAICGY